MNWNLKIKVYLIITSLNDLYGKTNRIRSDNYFLLRAKSVNASMMAVGRPLLSNAPNW
jgi:hypothetical protein